MTSTIPDQATEATEDVLKNLKEGEISPYVVMKSQAGHYVGTYIIRDGFLNPHSRISDYMPQANAAEWLANAVKTNSL